KCAQRQQFSRRQAHEGGLDLPKAGFLASELLSRSIQARKPDQKGGLVASYRNRCRSSVVDGEQELALIARVDVESADVNETTVLQPTLHVDKAKQIVGQLHELTGGQKS